MVGSLIKSRTATFPEKKIAFASLASGVLNSVYAYVFYLMTPRPRFTRGAAVSQTSELVFAFSSFIAGVLIVLAIVGIAKIFSLGNFVITLHRAFAGEDEGNPPLLG